jgi:hypothetical protein
MKMRLMMVVAVLAVALTVSSGIWVSNAYARYPLDPMCYRTGECPR